MKALFTLFGFVVMTVLFIHIGSAQSSAYVMYDSDLSMFKSYHDEGIASSSKAPDAQFGEALLTVQLTCPPDKMGQGCDSSDIFSAPLTNLPYSGTPMSASLSDLLIEGGSISLTCPIATLTYTDVLNTSMCGDTLIRTWMAEDTCSNRDSCSQMIVVRDTVAPDTMIGNNGLLEVLNCTRGNFYPDIVFTDDCGLASIDTIIDTIAFECVNDYTLEMRFVGTDYCGNSTTYSFAVEVVDNSAPFFAVNGDTTRLMCDDDTFIPIVDVADNCSEPFITDTIVEILDSFGVNRFTRFIKLPTSDSCGNVDTFYHYVIVNDTFRPTFMVSGDGDISDTFLCHLDTLSVQDIADSLLTFVDTMGDCGDFMDTLVVNIVPGTRDCDNDFTRTIQYAIGDSTNGYTDTINWITVVMDTMAPSFDGLVSRSLFDTTACASDTIMWTTVDVVDSLRTYIDSTMSCNDMVDSVGVEYTSTSTVCNNFVRTITYWIGDECHGLTDSAQWITVVVDTAAPEILCMPDTNIISCGTSIPSVADYPPLMVADNCGIDSLWNVDSLISHVDDFDTLYRTWIVRDSCGFTAECTQRFILSDRPRLNLRAYLEGAYQVGSLQMTNLLNVYRILPGQDPALSMDPVSNLVGVPTPAGQPYTGFPWQYSGTEGDEYGDTTLLAGGMLYESTVVDWVLLSVREGGVQELHTIWRCAALIHQDGRIEIPDGCECLSLSPSETYRIVIEHRNHLPIMSEELATSNDSLVHDFTMNEGWELGIGSTQEVSQKLISGDGVYALHSGNSDQSIVPGSRGDINANDYSLALLPDFGIVRTYLLGDINLDGDVNAADVSLHLIVNFGLVSFVF